MEGQETSRRKSPYLTANIFSKLFFTWIGPLFTLANKEKKLSPKDLYNILPSDESCYVGDKLERQWNKELQKEKLGKQANLFHALLRTFGSTYFFFSIFALTEEAIRIAQPFMMGKLIDYFSPNVGMEPLEAYLWAAGVTLCALFLTLVHSPFFFGIQRLAMRVRVSLCTLVYRKMLRLDNISMRMSSSGQVNNLMTNDVNRFDMLFICLHYLWVCPIQATCVLVLLWGEIGWACLPGYAILILLLPIQAFMSKLFGKLRRKTAAHTDKRVGVMTEIINAMRVIKMYAWEPPFGDLVQKIRKAEIRKIIQASYPMGINLMLSMYGNRLLDVCMIVTYAFTAKEIRVSTVFVVVSYCITLRSSFMRFFLRAVQMRSEALVSIKRIQKFLLLDEISLPSDDNTDISKDGVGIQVDNLVGSWDDNLSNPTLRNVSFDLNQGELLAVVGPVGSGKSTLLMALLKELPTVTGKVAISGRMAYASQEPWNFSGTLRENIIFGREFKKRKYEQIVDVCALTQDIKGFPEGDMTIIGERGVTLSGGQKARVNLARALYDDADIYILDDPLSAVDSEVGRHIFDRCIMGYLANKPRILITHQLQFLNTANKILVLKEGHMEAVGPLSELHEKGIDFATLMKVDDEDEEEEEDEEEVEGAAHPGLRKRTSTMRSIKSQKSVKEEQPGTTAAKAFKEEGSKKGDVAVKVYYKYFKAGGNCLMMFLLLFFFLGAQGAYILSDLWLAFWSEEEEKRQFLNITTIAINETDGEEGFNLDFTTEESAYIYGGFIGLLFICAAIRSVLSFNIMIRASRNIHNRMFRAIIRSPILFFDSNPAGRILNRFTKDIGLMDDQLPNSFFDFLQISLSIIGTVILTVIVNYYVLILVVPLTIVFVILRRYAVVASRAMKRLDGITRSPVFSHTTNTFQGMSTIRAYRKQAAFTREFNQHQDLHSAAWFAYLAANRWFGIRLDMIMVLFTAGVTLASVAIKDVLDGGIVAVILSNAISLTTIFQYVVRQSAMVENQMTSVERTLEYTKLKSEAPLVNSNRKPPPDWPQFGALTFSNLSLSYSVDSLRVLRDVTCNIMAREKVGIVGRTGAGKSSLIAALFRLTEPSGLIILDGTKTSDLGLHQLRKKLSIIPQDPVLFTGTLRYNLDPFNQYSDNEIWYALEDVQLRPVVQDCPDKLGMEVGESGSNFSVGQRQLICLARAILRQNKVLIMDEATANVDPRTDALIQNTIRTKFVDCTVLTIAHRLHTLMDSDRIMVLDAGQLIEFDQPHTLLQRPDSMLSKLVEQTGRVEALRLAEAALRHFKPGRVSGMTSIGFASPQEITVEGYNQQLQQWGANATGRQTESIGVQTETVEHLVVVLPRTSKGFGFSLAGSTDNPFMPVFVAQIVQGSPASFPYALQVGDEILAINGQDRIKLTYAQICQRVRDSKDRVQLTIRRRSNGQSTSRTETEAADAQKMEGNSEDSEKSPSTKSKQNHLKTEMVPSAHASDSSGIASMVFTNEAFEDAPLSVTGESAGDSTEGNSTTDVQVRISTSSSSDSEANVVDTKL